MEFTKEYLLDTEQEENSNKIYYKGNLPRIAIVKQYIDIENLVKIILSWSMGGIVSLLPTFIYIWTNSSWREQSKILEQFFSNKDLFLVVTTLTAGAMFEILCSRKNGIVKYSSAAIGIILMVFSVLVFSVLLFQDGISNAWNVSPYVGACLLGICFTYSFIGYFFVCWKGK